MHSAVGRLHHCSNPSNVPLVFLSLILSRVFEWGRGKGGYPTLFPILTLRLIKLVFLAGLSRNNSFLFSSPFMLQHVVHTVVVQLTVYESYHESYTDCVKNNFSSIFLKLSILCNP